MIVSRPHSAKVSAWNGRRFERRTIDTSDIAFVSNQIPSHYLDEMPWELGPFVRSIIFCYYESKIKPILVRDSLEDIYQQMLPRYEPEPVSQPTTVYR